MLAGSGGGERRRKEEEEGNKEADNNYDDDDDDNDNLITLTLSRSEFLKKILASSSISPPSCNYNQHPTPSVQTL